MESKISLPELQKIGLVYHGRFNRSKTKPTLGV